MMGLGKRKVQIADRPRLVAKLQRLADRDGIRIYSASPSGPDQWDVSLLCPAQHRGAPPKLQRDLDRLGILGSSPMLYVGPFIPTPGEVLLEWLLLAADIHPVDRLPPTARAYLETQLRAMLDDNYSEYLRVLSVYR